MSKALILSGGGPLAVAWECGLVGGLAGAGVSLRAADFILGTSAGAIVGAQIAAGRDPAGLAQAVLAEAQDAAPRRVPPSYPTAALAKLPELFVKSQAGEAGRREVCAYALAVPVPDSVAAYVGRMTALIGGIAWPEAALGIVAVDAADGEPRVLRRDCGATLGEAVAASCCLPGLSPPVPIAGRRYLDGGLRSIANVDLAPRCDSVLILHFTLPGPARERMTARALAEAEALSAAGTRVRLVSPDAACLAALGSDRMDFTRRPAVARAALAQGAEIAGSLGEVWG